MGFSKVSTVKKAAKLAVYEEIIMSAKKNHIPVKEKNNYTIINFLDSALEPSSKKFPTLPFYFEGIGSQSDFHRLKSIGK